MILVLVLAICLVACNNNAPATDSGDSSQQNNEDNVSDNSATYLTQNIQDVMDTATSVLNMSDYEIADGYDDGTWIKVSRIANAVSPDMNITLDGFRFSLPVKYTDLIGTGWKDTENLGEEQLEPNSITSIDFETTAGKSVSISFVNQSAETKAIKDLEAVKIEFTNAYLEGELDEDAPAFQILGSVNNHSNLEAILSANATPTYLDVSDDIEGNTVATSTIKYSDENNSIEIEYNCVAKTILNITMEYGISGSTIIY